MNAYIINNHNEPIARIDGEAKSGHCRYAFQKTAEAIDANRHWNLVNARSGRISNAKRWQEWERKHDLLPTAIEINPGHYFLIS